MTNRTTVPPRAGSRVRFANPDTRSCSGGQRTGQAPSVNRTTKRTASKRTAPRSRTGQPQEAKVRPLRVIHAVPLGHEAGHRTDPGCACGPRAMNDMQAEGRRIWCHRTPPPQPRGKPLHMSRREYEEGAAEALLSDDADAPPGDPGQSQPRSRTASYLGRMTSPGVPLGLVHARLGTSRRPLRRVVIGSNPVSGPHATRAIP